MANICSEIVVLTAVVVSLIAGCSTSNRTDGSTTIPQVISVQPAHGASGVPQGANIRLIFNTSMDTASVDHAFHLAGGPDMLRWVEALPNHRGINSHLIDMDSMMFRLDSMQYLGSFQWNAGADTVVFIPDTQLVAGQPHFIFLSGDIKGQNGRSMVMDTFSYGGYLVHFTTGS